MTNLKQYLENLKALEARATPGFWFRNDRLAILCADLEKGAG